MYEYLRKYIQIQKQELKHGSYGWTIKEMCEYCKDEELVNELLQGFKNIEYLGYCQDDMNMFSGMLDDIHISDALGTEDSIMLKIMIGCLTDEFILETDNSGYLTQFARYTRLGRQLYGRKQNILTEYTEKNWPDFSELWAYMPDGYRKMTDAEVIEKWNSEEFWSDFDEINARTGILIVDENMRNIDELEVLIERFAFEEIVPGMYFSGVKYWAESYADIEVYNSIEEEFRMDFLNMLQAQKKVRTLEPDLFIGMNQDGTKNIATKLRENMNVCDTRREVLL